MRFLLFRRLPAPALTLALALRAAEPVPPPGWKLELLLSPPALRHPSVVCAAPDGRVFVAEDPMDIRSPKASAREGRILCLHPDGRRTVWATNLHAVFGLQYVEGRLLALHNPRFTAFADGGDAAAGETDLIKSTNPEPWALDWNDHVPANFRLAMDGFLYFAVGDKGLYGATGTDGAKVDLHGGGIARIRPDGAGLSVVATGVRNILDVAMTSEDEMFTYDNTDENQWMGRFTHMVDGGFYGYPHDFIPRRTYTLWMLADYGPGAATGALALTGGGFPEDWRDDVVLADFGQRNLRRVKLQRAGGTFREVRNELLFSSVPEDFRPVGICESADGGSLLICDWQARDVKDTNAVVGRLWRLTPPGPKGAGTWPEWAVAAATGRQPGTVVADGEILAALGHPARGVRLAAQRLLSRTPGSSGALSELFRDASAAPVRRMHALWALDAIDGGVSVRADVLRWAGGGPPELSRQAIRQLGERRVREARSVLEPLLDAEDPSIRFAAATALGRIAEAASVQALLRRLELEPGTWPRYAAFTALNRIGRAHADAWDEIAAALDSPSDALRESAAHALRETHDPALARALITLAARPQARDQARISALGLLGAIQRRVPAWRGEWWAYHPFRQQPPARTEEWDGTKAIVAALTVRVDDAVPRVREAAVRALGPVGVADAPALTRRFAAESDPGVRSAIVAAFADAPVEVAGAFFLAFLRTAPPGNPLFASVLAALPRLRSSGSAPELGRELLRLAETGIVPESVVAPFCEALAALGPEGAVPVVLRLVESGSDGHRAAAARALASLSPDGAALLPLLKRPEIPVRIAAIAGLARVRSTNVVPPLLAAWRAEATRTAAAEAMLSRPAAEAVDVYLEVLASPEAALRERARKALAVLADAVIPALESRPGGLSDGVKAELRRAFAGNADVLARPLFAAAGAPPSTEEYEAYALGHPGDPDRGRAVFHDEASVGCIRCHRIGSEGGQVGPELTTAGTQFGRAALVEAVLYPGRTVREGYQQYIVETKDGETHAGAIRAESADTLTLVEASGQLVVLAKDRVASRSASGQSLMPEGLQEALTRERFVDLIAYLESLRPVKAAP